jgi:tetratricopeptide (TPR) repeat protein
VAEAAPRSLSLSESWPIVVSSAAFLVALLLAITVLLRRPSRRDKRRPLVNSAPQEPTVSPQSAIAPQESALAVNVGPSAAASLAGREDSATVEYPLRGVSEWRPAVTNGETIPARVASTTIPLEGSAAVAVAERTTPPGEAAVDASWASLGQQVVDSPPDATSADYDQATTEYRHGIALLADTSSERTEALRDALACFRRAQDVWTRERAPELWAAIQNDIGRAYQELPSGDRAGHLRTAIMYHQTALEVYDPVQHAINWAWTQSALGAAYQSLPTGSAISNARAAVAYHQRALDVFTEENAPLAWAWNQNNLGAAYEIMRSGEEGDRVAALREASRCYSAALRVYTAAEYPLQHHIVMRNLARVQAELQALE